MEYDIHKVGAYFVTFLFFKKEVLMPQGLYNTELQKPGRANSSDMLLRIHHLYIHSSYMCPSYTFIALSETLVRISLKSKTEKMFP